MELVIKLHKLKIYSANIHSVLDSFLVSPFIYYFLYFYLVIHMLECRDV